MLVLYIYLLYLLIKFIRDQPPRGLTLHNGWTVALETECEQLTRVDLTDGWSSILPSSQDRRAGMTAMYIGIQESVRRYPESELQQLHSCELILDG